MSRPAWRGGCRCLALVLLLAASPARAVLCGTALDPVTVTATSVSFGVYDASSPSATLSSGTVHIACTYTFALLPVASVRLSRGQASSYAPRRMSAGGQTLAYNLYTGSARSTVRGDGSGATQVITIVGALLASTDLTVYGALEPGQYVKAGVYSDVITVTVQY